MPASSLPSVEIRISRRTNAFLAHEIGFVLVVIFFQVLVLDDDVLADFLANHALAQHLVLHVVLEILERHAAVCSFTQSWNLSGSAIPDCFWTSAIRLASVAVDFDIEILGLLHQQQIVDAVAQQVFRFFGHFLVESSSGQALAA